MKRYFFIYSLVLISNISFSQDVGRDLDMRINPFIETKIEFRDGTTQKGYLKLESKTNLKFKDSISQKKDYKIDYKQVSNIINYVNYAHRVYSYRKTNRTKFLSFVEIITSSKNKQIEVYVHSPDTNSLFYQGIDRSNVRDYIISMIDVNRNKTNAKSIAIKNEGEIKNLDNDFIDQYYTHETSEEIKTRLSSTLAPKYLFGIKGEEKLYDVFSKKKLLSFAETNFSNCPEIIEKISKRKLKSEDALEILDLYNSCSQ